MPNKFLKWMYPAHAEQNNCKVYMFRLSRIAPIQGVSKKRILMIWIHNHLKINQYLFKYFLKILVSFNVSTSSKQYMNKCSDGSVGIVTSLSISEIAADRPTNQPIDMKIHREVTFTINYSNKSKIYSNSPCGWKPIKAL